MPRKRVHWGAEDGAPQGGWIGLGTEWEDPTFDEAFPEPDVCDTIDLSILTEKQRFVIESLYYDTYPYADGSKATLDSVALKMGISHQAVSKLKEKALKKLRKHIESEMDYKREQGIGVKYVGKGQEKEH